MHNRHPNKWVDIIKTCFIIKILIKIFKFFCNNVMPFWRSIHYFLCSIVLNFRPRKPTNSLFIWFEDGLNFQITIRMKKSVFNKKYIPLFQSITILQNLLFCTKTLFLLINYFGFQSLRNSCINIFYPTTRYCFTN